MSLGGEQHDQRDPPGAPLPWPIRIIVTLVQAKLEVIALQYSYQLVTAMEQALQFLEAFPEADH